MNRWTDPLEAELESLRPHELPPLLRQRIISALSEPRRRPPRAHPSRLWIGALAAAACLVIAVAIWRGREQGMASPGRSPVAAGSSPPTDSVVAYQRALAQSPEALDALLDADAVRPIGPPVSGAYVLAGMDPDSLR